jgi:uncharacterized membrane protein YagU involved in acid resistance
MKTLLRLLIGALGGVSATGPMTIAMIWLHRVLPTRDRYSLPPREVTLHLAEKLGVNMKLDRGTRAALTLINHFVFGATAATIYSLAESRIPGKAVIKGPIFGASVWLVSYFGLLPAVGILEFPTKQPLSRNALMLAVHLIWGLTVGVFSETVRSENRSSFGAAAGQPARGAKGSKVEILFPTLPYLANPAAMFWFAQFLWPASPLLQTAARGGGELDGISDGLNRLVNIQNRRCAGYGSGLRF